VTSARVITIDLKKDFTGAFIVNDLKRDCQDFKKVVSKGADNFKTHLIP
jgi:hypothetical protein